MFRPLLRSILRIRSINHAAKAAGRVILPARLGARFDRAMPLVDPFSIPLPNGRSIWFESFGDGYSKLLRYEGWNAYETSSVELFYALASHARVTFDVGAYLGWFGLLAAAARPGSRSYLFEAVPQLARFAGRIAARNPHLQVHVVEAAVSNASGTTFLYLPDDPLESDTSTNPAHRPDRSKVEVRAIALDDFVRDNRIESVDLLKIDTETTEPAVLAGCATTIARCRPPFICEVLPTADVPALERFCVANDYAAAWICDTGLRAMDVIEPDPRKKQLNYLFYPRNAPGPMNDEIARRLRPNGAT